MHFGHVQACIKCRIGYHQRVFVYHFRKVANCMHRSQGNNSNGDKQHDDEQKTHG